MNNIKHYINHHFNTLSIASVSIIFSITLLMLRVKFTHSFFYLFLVWNLFLAVIPFAITTYLKSFNKLNAVALWFSFCLWLLFLPNAPYIVTDLVHLRLSKTTFIWIDILTVMSFAFSGLLLFYLSFLDMISILKQYIKPLVIRLAVTPLLFLTAFGIYLGRVLRYNSWELIQNPLKLINDIFQIIIHPSQHKDAWIFTLLFGVFLNVGYWLFKMSTRLKTLH